MSVGWNSVHFLEDKGSCPPGLTLERKDSDADYCKSNCVWSNQTAQQNNRTNNLRIELMGRTETLAQWSKESGLPTHLIRYRYLQGFSAAAMLNPIRLRRGPIARLQRVLNDAAQEVVSKVRTGTGSAILIGTRAPLA